MRIFCAALTSLDAAIGKLLGYLEETGLARNTLIVFTSDNGPEDYHVGAASNAGMGSPGLGRGRKRSIYEGGVRVPCIVRWPGRVPAGRVSDAVWTGVDLMPTLAAIIGSQPPNAGSMDGEDVSDILLGAERQRRKEVYWEWKFEVRGNPDYLPPQLAVRDGDWKLLCQPDGTRVELYRIPADLPEKNNLAAAFPDRVEIMKRKLLDWKKTLPERYVYQDGKK
jgi:arylsulfatase A-like enzyme